MRRVAPLLLTALLLSGCSILEWMDEKQKVPIPGERVSVLSLESQVEPDPRISDLRVRIPKPYVNPDWPQSGGYPSHAMYHLELGPSPQQIWRIGIGASAGSEQKIVAQPVVGGGMVYAMDARTRVSAFDAETGVTRWTVSLPPEDEDKGIIGGGVAYDSGQVFATSPYGEIIALNARTGAVIWRSTIGIPFRSAPTVDGTRVFAISTENQLYALDRDDGRQLWTQAGIAEVAGLIGGASPAVDGNTVIVPYSSGELFALRADTGSVIWNDSLSRAARYSSVATIADITGNPVIDRGQVYAIGHSGRLIADDMRTGERIWDQDISGLQQVWAAGDFIYVVTLDAELVALWQRDGRVRWVTSLDKYKDPESKKDKGLILWYGPVLAGDRLIVASSQGEVLSISPFSGEVLGQIRLSAGAAAPPVVADETLYILAEDASLIALR